MAENRQNFFQVASWLFMAEDSSTEVSVERSCFARGKNMPLLDASRKDLGWIKAVFWVIMAQISALLISFL